MDYAASKDESAQVQSLYKCEALEVHVPRRSRWSAQESRMFPGSSGI